MKRIRLAATAFCLVAGLLLAATSSYAQSARPQVMAVGSSGAFPSAAIAAVTADPITSASAPCGTNFWTESGNDTNGVPFAAGIDNRQGTAIPAEPGTIWIAWDNSTTPTVVCAYLSVDSIVGDRLFFSQAMNGGIQTNGFISLSSQATTTGGQCKVSFVQDTGATCNTSPITPGNPLPTAIYNIVNGANFNVAFTDIRPEDAVYENTRALQSKTSASCPLPAQCFGYVFGLTTAGQYAAVKSTYGSGIANVVPFSIPAGGVPGSTDAGASVTDNGITVTMSVDPITSLTIPSANTYGFGADPIIVFVNMAGTQTGSFKNLNPTNVNSRELSEIWNGQAGQTCAVANSFVANGEACGPFAPLTVLTREPVSGTYTTFEWQAVRDRDAEAYNSQESLNLSQTGINCAAPPTACYDPLWSPVGFDNAVHTRVIGTGEMVSTANSATALKGDNVDRIGYAFWSLGTFGGKTNLKYLTVDGVDPVVDTYSENNGAMPNCTGYFNVSGITCTGYTLPTFSHIKDGSYRIWNIIRAVVDVSVQSYQATTLTKALTPQLFIQESEDAAQATTHDVVPVSICANSGCTSTTPVLEVFRSHYGQTGVFPNNGVEGPFCVLNGCTPPPEGGGDVEGAAVPTASEYDYINFVGLTGEGAFYNIIQ